MDEAWGRGGQGRAPLQGFSDFREGQKTAWGRGKGESDLETFHSITEDLSGRLKAALLRQAAPGSIAPAVIVRMLLFVQRLHAGN